MGIHRFQPRLCMPSTKALSLIASLAAMGLAGCAHYAPLPLNPSARFASSVNGLHGGASASTPLTEAEVVQLVLQNNPSLQLAAIQHRETEAQGRGGALLPNPSFSGSLGYLLSGAGNATAWTAGLAQGVNGWITLKARRDEAKASLREVDASLAWQAWQGVGKARMLVADVVLEKELLRVQVDLADALGRQSEALARAKARGDIDATVSGPVALAAAEARANVADTERALADKRRELASLMGLAFDADVTLAPLLPLQAPDPGAVDAAIDGMAAHRPDLVALRMGYDAEDARFRQAILSQFPPLTIGYNASQDNSRVTNGGPALVFDLPVFDRGRARVDAEAATRQRLHDEYGYRIADATDEARALLAACQRSRAQWARLDQIAAGDADPLATASSALHRGDVDQATYTDIAVARLSRQVTLIRLQIVMREQRAAMDTLLGTGMPEIHLLAGTP